MLPPRQLWELWQLFDEFSLFAFLKSWSGYNLQPQTRRGWMFQMLSVIVKVCLFVKDQLIWPIRLPDGRTPTPTPRSLKIGYYLGSQVLQE